jgi:hypothetical protein
MVESLLSPSSVKLFGRVLNQLYVLSMEHAKEGAKAAAKVAKDKLHANPNATAVEVRAAVVDFVQSYKVTNADQSVGAWAVENAVVLAAARPSATGKTVVKAAKVKASTYDVAYPKLGQNRFLRSQLDADDRQLSVIYSFAFEGRYYDLPRPTVFLVHGDGLPITPAGSGSRTNLDIAGVIAKEWEFSESLTPGDQKLNDLRVWEYDKGDFSIRMDIETGPLEQILLAAMMRGGSSLSAAHNLGANHNLGASHNLGIGGLDPRNRR